MVEASSVAFQNVLVMVNWAIKVAFVVFCLYCVSIPIRNILRKRAYARLRTNCKDFKRTCNRMRSICLGFVNVETEFDYDFQNADCLEDRVSVICTDAPYLQAYLDRFVGSNTTFDHYYKQFKDLLRQIKRDKKWL